MSEPLTLLDSAARLGHYRYVELRGFARLGARAPRAAPALAGFLAGAARAHAHRAGLLEARLPLSIGIPHAAELTVAPDLESEGLLDELLGVPDEQLLGALVEGLYPSLLAAYRAHLGRCSPFSDPPVARLLGRLIADLEGVLGEASALGPAASGGPAALLERLSARGGVLPSAP
ncbi:MAG TPA: hypothetical protein VNF07_10760 [Acidimicrobiales bacterium]|nr:hypothetical protein [Acidimicrobiales bacterium]